MKKTITIKAPSWANVSFAQEWPATYEVAGTQNVRHITIEARSAIEVVVARVDNPHPLFGGPQYYVSSPNFGVAIPYTPDLTETRWITEKLIGAEMNAPDAVTVAQVLRDMGDF